MSVAVYLSSEVTMITLAAIAHDIARAMGSAGVAEGKGRRNSGDDINTTAFGLRAMCSGWWTVFHGRMDGWASGGLLTQDQRWTQWTTSTQLLSALWLCAMVGNVHCPPDENMMRGVQRLREG